MKVKYVSNEELKTVIFLEELNFENKDAQIQSQ